jgi:hypothetical protein
MARWSEAKRSEALQLLRDQVGTQETARRTGVPAPTLSRWAAAEGIESPNAERTASANEATRLAWVQRRGQLVDRLGDVSAELLEKARNADAREAQAFMTAVAIGVDKAQLLSGSATSRHEVLDAQRRRERVDRLQDELAERRTAKDGTTGS